MEAETLFRVIFAAVLVLTIAISAYFRRKARKSGESISRLDEGPLALLLRLTLTLPLLASFVAYVANPRWMAWSAVDLPKWVHWIGCGLALGCIPLFWWVLSNIGKNISETVLTKKDHQLVTKGPYRWMRHPLYAVALLQLCSLSIIAGNWFMLLLWSLGLLVFRFVVIPKEEEKLIMAFGQEYGRYQKVTGALMPRFRS